MIRGIASPVQPRPSLTDARAAQEAATARLDKAESKVGPERVASTMAKTSAGLGAFGAAAFHTQYAYMNPSARPPPASFTARAGMRGVALGLIPGAVIGLAQTFWGRSELKAAREGFRTATMDLATYQGATSESATAESATAPAPSAPAAPAAPSPEALPPVMFPWA
jgi:hypothetical protein